MTNSKRALTAYTGHRYGAMLIGLRVTV